MLLLILLTVRKMKRYPSGLFSNAKDTFKLWETPVCWLIVNLLGLSFFLIFCLILGFDPPHITFHNFIKVVCRPLRVA